MSLAALPLVFATLFEPPAAGSLQPVDLRCEHRSEPRGIDARQPVLAWRLVPVGERRRGLVQTAWQVRVASEPRLLAGDGAVDLWDSGRVAGRASTGEYAGKPLASGQRCYWQVRAWDQDGAPGPWSGTAAWTMGLLEPGDWQAKWIGYDAPLALRERGPDLDGATWLWPKDDRGQPVQGERIFRGQWRLPEGFVSARLVATADDQFELWLNGKPVAKSDGKPDAWRRPVVLDVSRDLEPGVNIIAARVRNTGHEGGWIAKLVVETEGEALARMTDVTFCMAEGDPPGWQGRDFADAAWLRVTTVGAYGVAPWQRIGTDRMFLPPPRLLAKTFTTAAAPSRATLYASALGLYEVELNGKKVGDAFFTPGWTDYGKRVYYQAYDVTADVRKGDNELRVWLADGWHSGYVGYGHKRDHYGEATRACLQLVLETADGGTQVVATDPSWRATTGELREADFLMGETCDRTVEPGPWQPVDASEHAAVLQSHPGHPVRIIAELVPVSVKRVGDDVFVCDLGQNIAGFARLRVQGERGRRITLRFAERLDADGQIYTKNLRMARCTDTYICKGGGVETWQPRFTFHGFQYVEVRGLGREPGRDTITGVALSSDTPMQGDFACSDPMVNKLVSNIRWTQRMNFLEVPTDCPQRDERLGWTGDAQAYLRTATCLADVQAFFWKWLLDLTDAQREDGQFPMVAPLKVAGADGGPAWADAGVICPWDVYEVYGDRRLLERQYPSMVRFVEFCRGRSTPELMPPEKFHCFGDWLHVGDPTPNEVIFSAYFAQSTRLLARSAAALGKTDDAERYDALWRGLRAAFEKAYVEPDGQVRGHSQTAYVLALAFDLVEGERRQQAAQHLVAHLEKRGWHLSTGFVGTKDLMLVLDKIGRNDLAYRLLANQTFPSWGFTVVNGATSIWERWDGWTPDKGFQDPGMNSFAHYAFGAVGQWLFEVPGGIRSEGPGYQRLVIRPQPGGALTWAKTRQGTVHGQVATAWRLEGDQIVLEVTVPPNATAVVHVPTKDPASVRLEGARPEDVAGVERRGAAAFEVGSGTWSFTATRG